MAGASGAHGASSSVDSRGAAQAQAPAAVSSRAQGGGTGGEARGREPRDVKDLGCPCEEAFVKCRLSSRLYRDGILQGQVFSLRYFTERGGEVPGGEGSERARLCEIATALSV